MADELLRLLEAAPHLPSIDETPPCPEMDAWIAEQEAKRLARLAHQPRRKLCGAKAKRTGQPCRRWAMPNGRCLMHGGASTGPKTEEGKAKAREALRRYWEKRRE